MSTIYVDETAGSDETGKGTAESPYLTLQFAVYTHPEAALLTRKDASATFEEPTASSLKKAKKGAEGLEKKRKKAEELAQRDAAQKALERERREKLLEESKKIVLTEDSSLPAAKKVCVYPRFAMLAVITSCVQAKLGKLNELRSQRVRVSGWVHRLRDQKGIIFIVLRDGTGYLQCVLTGKVVRCSLTHTEVD